MPPRASSAGRVISLLALCLCQAHARSSNLDEDFHNFITRPDIQAPKWTVSVYNESAIAPGYWFIAPYGEADNNARVGPHIYDGTGELVWSGAPMFDGARIFDFRVATVDDKDVITLIDPSQDAGLILDDGYNIVKKVHIGDAQLGTLNIHDFNIAGDRALFVHRSPGTALKDESTEVGFHSGECSVMYDGFEERDINHPLSGPSFSWSSKNHAALEESALSDASSACNHGWDYFHANAIDKFPDGDYLLNGRFTGTIYKISAKDGSIVWRLGGKHSDFKLDRHAVFSAQGHARVQTQTETHTTISLIDNAILNSDTTNDQSRGLLLVLRTDQTPMTAKIVAKYNHPHNKYANNQGNFQILPNGNAFLGWRDQALQSEHTQDGKVIMEANLLPQLLSYRNFKLNWVGRPSQPPDVYAACLKEDGAISTIVYVSWNGATEVAAWNLYRATINGRKGELLVSRAPRHGFETAISYQGYVQHVVVEALDARGKSIGTSKLVKSDASSAIEAGSRKGHGHRPSKAGSIFSNALVTLLFGCIVGSLGVVIALRIREMCQRPPWLSQYSRVPHLNQEWELEEVSEREDNEKDNG